MPTGSRVCRASAISLTWLALAALAANAEPAASPSSAPTQEPVTSNRPRIGLALSGGGARGFAHAGVLQVLEELQIPVDYVAGTSMGAVVGGLYASGLSPAALVDVVASIDWATAFIDQPPRREKSFRRKRDDFNFLTNLRLYVKDWKLALPKGLIEGQRISNILSALTTPVATVRDFDALLIPFRAIATDATTGEAVVISRGNLSRAIRASMAIPGFFSPVEIDGRLVVDGGVAKNLPIDVVREMGADIIIAVDIGTDPGDTTVVTSVLSISGQMLSVLMHKNTLEQLALLRDDDILIRPELGTISAASFERGLEGIALGIEATRAASEQLNPLAAPNTFEAFAERRAGIPTGPPQIDRVRFDNDSPLSTRVIERRIEVDSGKPLDLTNLIEDLDALYGDGLFDRVQFSIDAVGDQQELVIHTEGKDTGRNYMQFGLNLETNFKGESLFNLGTLITRNPVNGLGAEWRADIQVGEATGLFTEFYQPLDYGSNFFVAPEFIVGIRGVNEFVGGERIAKFEESGYAVKGAVGWQPGNWGELRAGLGYGDTSTRRIIGSPLIRGRSIEGGFAFGRLTLDTLDSVRFPRSGGLLTAEAEYRAKTLGSSANVGIVGGKGLYAFTFGENTISPSVSLGTTFEDELGTLPPFSIGGFLRLSGLSPGERTGRHVVFGSIVAYRRLANPRFFTLSLPVYLGGSIEFGNAFQSRNEIRFSRLIPAGSAFLGVDTPLGPIYLAVGFAEGGRTSGYLFLGQRF